MAGSAYRWTQIFEAGTIPASTTVHEGRAERSTILMRRLHPSPSKKLCRPFTQKNRIVVFAPHVETSSGIILPDGYVKAIGEAVRDVGGLFVLDCIASGCVWVDMKECHVDVLISAPQKGWSASPSAGPRDAG